MAAHACAAQELLLERQSRALRSLADLDAQERARAADAAARWQARPRTSRRGPARLSEGSGGSSGAREFLDITLDSGERACQHGCQRQTESPCTLHKCRSMHRRMLQCAGWRRWSAGGEPHMGRMMLVSASRAQLRDEQRPALRQAAEVRESALRAEAEAQRRAELAQHQQLLGTMQCGTPSGPPLNLKKACCMLACKLVSALPAPTASALQLGLHQGA